MRKNLFIVGFILIYLNASAISDKFRIGFATSPGISWLSAPGKDLEKGKVRFGIDYGLVLEYWFAKNYGISTGIMGSLDGGNIKGRDLFERDSNNVTFRQVNEKYIFQNVALPVYLKLKTNELKRIVYWGQIGFDLNFAASARASYSNPIGNNIVIDKENIARKSNEVTKVIPGFRSGIFDFRLGAGAGIEYAINDKTSFMTGIFYHNGFINSIIDKDAKKEANNIRFISLRVGILF